MLCVSLSVQIFTSLLSLSQCFTLSPGYIRLCAQVPAIVLMFIFTWTPYYPRFHQLSNTAFTLVLGMSFIAMGIVGKDPSHGPQMLLYFVIYNFVELRVFQAAAVSTFLLILFSIATNVFPLEADSKFVFETSFAYLLISNFTLMFAAYQTEYW